MSLPRYAEYKDRDEQWLESIPKSWVVQAISRVLAAQITDGPHTTPVFVDDGVPFLSVDGIQDGDLVFDGCRYVSEEDHAEFSLKAAPRRDDILMAKAASVGKVARVKTDLEFSIWSPLALIRVDEKNCLPPFMEYSLKAPWLQAQIETRSNSNTQLNIGMKDIPKLRMCLPPIDDQSAIVSFLDRETGKIDALIAEQEKLLTLLAEKRQATISHAVTRGLNPNAPMKDSGVPWLGEVPAHWERAQLGRLCTQVSDGPHFSPSYVDDGVMFISARNIRVDGWSLEDAKYVSEGDYQEFCKRVIPEVGDVLYTKGGTTGIARVVDLKDRFQVWVHVAVLKLKKDVALPHYVAYALNSLGCYEQSQLYTRGATNQDLGLTRMVKILLALPPVEEQTAVVNFLDAETSMLDALNRQSEQAISLLKERRSALIAAAVTGKIDVRNAA